MKISELIVQLLPLLHEHGDIDVKIYDLGLRDPEPELVKGVCEL